MKRGKSSGRTLITRFLCVNQARANGKKQDSQVFILRGVLRYSEVESGFGDAVGCYDGVACCEREGDVADAAAYCNDFLVHVRRGRGGRARGGGTKEGEEGVRGVDYADDVDSELTIRIVVCE